MICCQSKTPHSHLVCPKAHFVDGMLKSVFQLSEPHLGTVSSILKKLDSQCPQEKLYCTQESVVASNPTIYKDKKISYEKIYLKNCLPTSSKKLETSDQASTSKEKVLRPFWNKSFSDLYEQLSWLPETDCVVSGSNSSNGCVNNTVPISWFSTTKIQPLNKNLEKISCPSSKFIVADGMENDVIKTTSKCLKLRLRPNKEQKKTLEKWAHASRYTYNATIAALNNPKIPWKSKNKYKLRNRFVTSKTRKKVINNYFNNKSWLLTCPKAIRKGAVDDATAACKAAFTNLKHGNIKCFNLRYRTRKSHDRVGWSMYLEKTNVYKRDDKLVIFANELGEMKYCSTKQLHRIVCGKEKRLKNSVQIHPTADCRLQKDAFGDYYLNVPITITKREPKQRGIAAIDPGVRKFVTTYSPDKQESWMFGIKFMETLWPLLYRYDKLCSEISQSSGTVKCAKEKETKRIRKRIHNLKKELMFQTANCLVSNYDTLLVPKLDTLNIISSPRGLKNKAVRRAMQNAGHCQLYQHLKAKCEENGVRFIHVTEEYTSQTCHKCGSLRKTSSETKHCYQCGYIGDRDLIAALNILLKAIAYFECCEA